ncbi:MAG: prolyl oligopeptidase family serine peptidase [Waddliaceae bacterium]
MTNSEIDILKTEAGTTLYHLGPSLSQGSLPTLFYFALTGEESLNLLPFSKVPKLLSSHNCRVFSLTLPYHTNDLPHTKSMKKWAEALSEGRNFISPFIEQCLEAIDFVIKQGYTDPARLATAGISRGGYIASALAAKEPRVSFILGFAPVTDLTVLQTFDFLKEDPFSVVAMKDQLISKQIKYYIGNRDERVGTEHCIESLLSVINAAANSGIRSPKIELVMYPSIGFKGHGTPDKIFSDGASWLKNKLID